MTTHLLVEHGDIQKWILARHGQPALSRVRDPSGQMQSRLAIHFTEPEHAPPEVPTLDDGISPCSWTAWLAELDRQNLALRVGGSGFEFVDRRWSN